MTTVSGDPHPSDPEATRPIGIPTPGQDATRSDLPATGGGATSGSGPGSAADSGPGSGGNSDADATATMATDDPDASRQVRRTDS